jgi:chemotaxis protein methyltransferase CheR
VSLINDQSVEELEIDLLLEGVFQRFGHDFRGYQRKPLRHKLHKLMQSGGLATVSSLQDRVMHDAAAGDALLRALSVSPAGMFEDPEHFRALRELVGPWLRSCPSPKVWIAECASAAEAATVAILLAEERLYDRTRIFATVANESVLQEARSASLAPGKLDEYEKNYRRSGGRKALSDYFVERNGCAVLLPEVLANVTWAQYNLATDASFNEFELIICRRTLDNFGAALRRRTLQLFYDSMALFGMLSVDVKNELDAVPFANRFKTICPESGLYRRIA